MNKSPVQLKKSPMQLKNISIAVERKQNFSAVEERLWPKISSAFQEKILQYRKNSPVEKIISSRVEKPLTRIRILRWQSNGTLNSGSLNKALTQLNGSHSHKFAVKKPRDDRCFDFVIYGFQGSTFCGASSEPDFIQIDFLLKRMFRFFRHSRRLMYFNVSQQKVTYYNVFGQNRPILMRERKRKEERVFFAPSDPRVA